MNHARNSQKNRLRFHPSAFLLLAQLLQLFFYAALQDFDHQRGLIGAVSVVILVLIVWVVNHSPAINWLTWVLAIPTFVLQLLSATSSNSTLFIISSLLSATLYFYAAGSLIAYMMGDERVTTDELFAVGATFTLIAWGFADLYIVCETLLPGSFVSSVIIDRPLNFFEFLFLSFTNLSSAGLSDIVPVTVWARVLIMLEQFVGIGYVAIVVSRLIGLTIHRQSRKHS